MRFNLKEMLSCGPIIISAFCFKKPTSYGGKIFGSLGNSNFQRRTLDWIRADFLAKLLSDDIIDFGNYILNNPETME